MPKGGYSLAAVSLLALGLFFFFINLRSAEGDGLYFLNAGQGESELVNSGGARILVDAGYTGGAVSALDKIVPEKYLDLGIISELQTDYFNGYNFLLQNYGLGAILWNGRGNGNSPEWQALSAEAQKRNIPMIPVAAGDVIRAGKAKIKVVSPNRGFQKSGQEADASLVLELDSPGIRALLAGGIGANVESALTKAGLAQANVLKVPAQAAKNSASAGFLNAVRPGISVISTGPKTLPDPDALGRLKAAGSLVFQTGLSGTVKIAPQSGKLLVFTEK